MKSYGNHDKLALSQTIFDMYQLLNLGQISSLELNLE